MAPSKKTSATQSNTLLNFFARNDESPATPAKKRKISESPRPTASTSTRKKSTRKQLPGGDEECPVVISDDEEVKWIETDEAGPSRLQGRKRGSRRGTVERHISRETTAGNDTRAESPMDLEAPESEPPISTSEPENTAPFGPAPPPALPNPFPSHPTFAPPPTWPKIISTSPDFGDPENPNEDAIDFPDPIAATLAEEIPPSQPTNPPLFDDTDEWNEGDEEGMGMEDPEDEGLETGTESALGSVRAVEVDLEEEEEFAIMPAVEVAGKGKGKGKEKARVEENKGDCPVCGKVFGKGKEKQMLLHVNTCLDSSTRSTPRKPMSSYLPSLRTASPPAPEPPTKGPNAFSVLMSGHKEVAEWKVAEDDLKRDGKRIYGRRKAPFYKVLTGMPIAVDAFRYGAIPGIKAYFLTHAHSDHYTNLSGNWKNGPIYCSETTGNLIQLMLGVDKKWVHGIPWDVPYELPDTGGVKVTVIKANHCPGSSLFLFEGLQTVNAGDSIGFKSAYLGGTKIWRYLHCGDFRACPKHVLHPAIQGKQIDTVYLDTTYLNPRYCFPPQPLVIQACANLARRTILGPASLGASDVKPENGEEPDLKPYLEGQIDADQMEKGKKMMSDWLIKEEPDEKMGLVEGSDVVVAPKKKKGRTLVIIGTYSIGKERIVKGVARALNSKVYCDTRKRGILLCQADPELHAMLTDDPFEASIHLVPLQTIQLDRLQPYLHRMEEAFDRILAFRPTGWTYSAPAGADTLPDVNMVIKRDQKRTFTESYLRPMRGSSRQFMLFGIPYSEHSSFFELTCFALSVPGPNVKMIATVNVGNETSRGKMKKWFEKWQAEKVKRQKAGLPAIVDYRDETFW